MFRSLMPPRGGAILPFCLLTGQYAAGRQSSCAMMRAASRAPATSMPPYCIAKRASPVCPPPESEYVLSDDEDEVQTRIFLLDVHPGTDALLTQLVDERIAHLALRLAVAVDVPLVIARLEHARERHLVDGAHRVGVKACRRIPSVRERLGEHHERRADRRA